ncbi:hypothetical protein PVAP13_9KG607501 [Panicum virgatum]|uniref:pectinesterase n=1 Tax=Panicum virgatum TaxID=38727 RepID=A0A8T0NYG6_PANVG|nr:hypothetical protein PVAP13_9KG607501 [Panicum virgatum]
MATRIKHTQSTEVIGTGTFSSAAVIVEGDDFIAENAIFKNSAPQVSGQAAAACVTADRCAFYNCHSWVIQETLHLHGGKQFFKNCYIEGNCDFIFGDSTALLEHCHTHCKSTGYITAHGRKSSSESTGFVFFKCVITGNGEAVYMYLGRPWDPFGRVVFVETFMDQDHCIEPVGMLEWVAWCKKVVSDEAIPFLCKNFRRSRCAEFMVSPQSGTKLPVSIASP